MSFDWNVESNHNHVANYQVSGLPFSAQVAGGNPVEFPRVTRWVVLKALEGPITVFFEAGNVAQGFTISEGETTPRLELRCAEIFTVNADNNNTGTLHVIAGLTTCNTESFIPSAKFSYPNP